MNDTKTVELAIARYKQANGRPITNNYKSKLCDCYATYCKLNQIFWEKPIYTPEPTTIQPPTQEKVQMLIASAKGRLSILIDYHRRTGLRPIEILRRERSQSQRHPPRNKHHHRTNNQRMQPKTTTNITPELMGRIQDYIRKHNLRKETTYYSKATSKDTANTSDDSETN